MQSAPNPAKKIRKAVIPAAGLGTRFLPATKASPKEMLPIVDKPIIQYVVEEAVAAGIEQIIIVTGRGKRAIEDHFDISYELEEELRGKKKEKLLQEVERISNMVEFCYVRQKRPLGLGHAVLCARRLVNDEPFAVLLGDDIFDGERCGLRQMVDCYEDKRSPVLAIQQVSRSEVSSYGIIDGIDEGKGLYRLKDMVEKPSPREAPSDLAVIGRYILTPEIFDFLEKTTPGKGGEIQLTDGIRQLLRAQPVYGLKLEGKRYDAGSKLGFLQATVEFALKNPELGDEFRSYLRTLKL